MGTCCSCRVPLLEVGTALGDHIVQNYDELCAQGGIYVHDYNGPGYTWATGKNYHLTPAMLQYMRDQFIEFSRTSRYLPDGREREAQWDFEYISRIKYAGHLPDLKYRRTV